MNELPSTFSLVLASIFALTMYGCLLRDMMAIKNLRDRVEKLEQQVTEGAANADKRTITV